MSYGTLKMTKNHNGFSVSGKRSIEEFVLQAWHNIN